MEFEVTGLDEAIENVRKIAASITDRHLESDGLEALQPVVDDAQSLAPVDEGDLRDSIKAKVLEDGTVGVVIEDWKGHFYEFGTVHHRAQPMLIPAFEANEAIVVEMFGGRVGARIEGAI